MNLEFMVGTPKCKSVEHKTLYSDIAYLPATMTFSMSLRIFNYDTEQDFLYMQVVASGTGWTGFASANYGAYSKASNEEQHQNAWATKARPVAESSETITVTLNAYTDAGYTALKHTYTRIITIYYIKSDDGSWTTDYSWDFETGTLEGWNFRNIGGNGAGYPTFAVSNVIKYGNWSAVLTQRTNAAHAMYQHIIYIRDGTAYKTICGEGGNWVYGSSTCAIGQYTNSGIQGRWILFVVNLTSNETKEIAIKNRCVSRYAYNNACNGVEAEAYIDVTTPNRTNVFLIISAYLTTSGSTGMMYIDEMKIVSKN